MCVCVREREKHRERKKERKREKERDRGRERKESMTEEINETDDLFPVLSQMAMLLLSIND